MPKFSCRFLLLLALFALLPPSATSADMSKTLRALITGTEGRLDPAVASNESSLQLIENIFDPLLRYDYLARPVRLQPNTAAAMPEIRDGGKTYVFRLKHGIRFSPAGAFGGRARELTAQDYVYSFKRLYDPALKSPWLFLFDGKLAGDEALKRRYGPDVEIAGLKALDRHTLQIRLNAPDRNFLYLLAMPATSAVAREAIEDQRAQDKPVGTGPYLVEQWQRGHRIQLRANPDYPKTVFHAGDSIAAEDRLLAAALDGRELPLVGRIDVRVIEEEQARLLGFMQGEFDYLDQVPASLIETVTTQNELKPRLAAQGIRLSASSPLQTVYMWMNMADPVLGGYTPEKIALRRAIAMAYPREEDIRVLNKGLALPAASPLPPGIDGYDPSLRNPNAYDPALARALLERFGYRIGADGVYRTQADGRPMTLVMHSITTAAGRLRNELWKRSLDAIGIRVEFRSDKLSEIIKAAHAGKVQMFETNWIADFPDAENFFQLLYGPNAGRTNYAGFNLPEFNRLYEKTRNEADPGMRHKLYRDMTLLIHAYAPWVICTHPLSIDLRHDRVRNYKRHPATFTAWRYMDVDKAATVP